MSTYVSVEISPETTTSPVLTSVSHATRPLGSSVMTASSTPAGTWSARQRGRAHQLAVEHRIVQLDPRGDPQLEVLDAVAQVALLPRGHRWGIGRRRRQQPRQWHLEAGERLARGLLVLRGADQRED